MEEKNIFAGAMFLNPHGRGWPRLDGTASCWMANQHCRRSGLFDGPGAGAVGGSCPVPVAFVVPVVLVVVLVVVVLALVSEVASSSASTSGAAVLGLAGGVVCGNGWCGCGIGAGGLAVRRPQF